MKPTFTVSASELDAGGKEYQRAVPHAWLEAAFADSEATPLGEGAVDVRLSKSGSDVIVHGKVKADVEVPCSRCLEPVRVGLQPAISVMFEPRARRKPKEGQEVELTTEEADVLPFDGENVVLDDVIRDDLLLEVPMIPLCSESCPGIASPEQAARQADHVDPRLAPLLAFKKRDKE